MESGLLTTDGETYAFRHALFQEAIYGDLLPGERVRLHARFAELLAADPLGGPAELAHHLLASHDLPGALAASVLAAAAAEQMAAPAEALRHLEQAISLFDRVGGGADAGGDLGLDRLDLLIRAAEAAAASGDSHRAVALGTAAVLAADQLASGEVQIRAMTLERLARLQFEADVEDDRPSREALELLVDGPRSALLARALATRARAMFRQQDPAATAAMLDEAIRIAGETGAHSIAADALITLNLMVRRGFLVDRQAPTLGATLVRLTGPDALDVRHRALRFQAAQLMEDGDLDGALAAADEGVALTSEAGLSWSSYGLDLRLMRGWVLAAQGRWDEVLTDSLVAVYAPTEPGRVLATQAVAVLVGRGDPEAEPLLARLRGTGDQYAELQLDLTEIDLRLDQGRPAEAAEMAEKRATLLSDDGWSMEKLLLAAREAAALADLADLARREGVDDTSLLARADAVAATADALPGIPALEGPYGRSWRLRVRAEVDRSRGLDTAEQWREVLTAAISAGRVQDQMYARVRAAHRLLDEGTREGAADLLRTALSQATGLGSAPSIAAIQQMAARARLTLSGDRLVRPTDSLLTAREAEVLALVEKGLSNRAVGETLFISAKTAGVHLSHIMAKLGATTRTEAVSLARRRGLLAD